MAQQVKTSHDDRQLTTASSRGADRHETQLMPEDCSGGVSGEPSAGGRAEEEESKTACAEGEGKEMGGKAAGGVKMQEASGEVEVVKEEGVGEDDDVGGAGMDEDEAGRQVEAGQRLAVDEECGEGHVCIDLSTSMVSACSPFSWVLHLNKV